MIRLMENHSPIVGNRALHDHSKRRQRWQSICHHGISTEGASWTSTTWRVQPVGGQEDRGVGDLGRIRDPDEGHSRCLRVERLVRSLGIPTIADRVVQAALKLVLEPIFEADFEPVSYGFRPKRRVLASVKAFLKAAILTELGQQRDTLTGTPQGAILSPLLFNIALTVLDEHLHGPWKTGGT
jgi:hypothetical protein